MGLLADIKTNIQVGDTIVLRNGEEHTVTQITIETESETHQPLEIHWATDSYWYTINGYWDPHEDGNDYDIVKVIKHTELG